MRARSSRRPSFSFRVVRPSAALLATAAVLALVLPTAASAPRALAQAALPEAYHLVATWPAQPQPRPAGELSEPAGIDVADDGRIFVVDRAESVVHVLSAGGAGVGLVGHAGSGAGQLRAPSDVAIMDGRAYVTDTGNGRLQVFDAVTLGFLVALPFHGQPQGIAAAGGRLYVSHADAPRVSVLDTAGRTLATWGEGGTAGDLALTAPRGLDVAGDRAYIADTGAQSVVITDLDGRVVERIDRTSESPAYDAPLDVVADGQRIWMVSSRRLYGYRRFLGNWIGQPGPSLYGGLGLALTPGGGLAVSVDDARAVFTGVLHFPNAQSTSQGAPERWGSVPAALGALSGPRRLAASGDQAFLLDGLPRLQRWAGGRPGSQARVESALDVLAVGGEPAVVRIAGTDRRQDVAWRVSVLAAGGGEVRGWDLPGGSAWYTAADGDGGRWAALDTTNAALQLHDGARLRRVDLGGTLVDVAVGGSNALVADRAALALRLLDGDGAEVGRWSAPAGPIRASAAPGGSRWFALMADGWAWAYAPDGRPLAAFQAAPDGVAVDIAATVDGRLLVADGARGRILVYAPDPTGMPAEPPTAGDRCVLDRDKVAAPTTVDVGEPVTVTLTVDGRCPTRPIPLDLVMVIDRSGSMEGPKLTAAQAAAIDFTAELDFTAVNAALVSFSSDPSVDQGLTADRSRVVGAIARLAPWGGTDIGRAINAAAGELAGPRARTGVTPAIVLLTDGLPDSPRGARDAAQAARDAGIALYTIGLGRDVDAGLLRELAGADERAFIAPTEAELSAVYAAIARRLAAARLFEHILVTDEVPANMDYEDGSAVPPATWDGRRLSWDLADIGATGVRLTYRLRPRDAGTWPTNVRADAAYRDGVGFEGWLVFPVPIVRVLGTRAVYLPFLQQSVCPEQRIDVVLVVDSSSSMLGEASPGGPTKLDVAKRAVGDFLSFLDLPADQAAIVDFNSTARVRQRLTGDGGALVGAVAAIASSTGTRIDLGLGAALDVLGRGRRRGNLPVVVILTDGQPDGGTRDDALALATRLRDEVGALVYAVGLGTDLDGGFLVQLVGDPERALFVPDAGRLYSVYRDIAFGLPCAQ